MTANRISPDLDISCQKLGGWNTSIYGTCSSRTGSLPSGRVDLTGDEDPTDEDGDIEIGDSTEVLVSFGDEIFSKGLGKMFLDEAGK
ncbi:hypothetical protein Tco_1031688 [Tanacetum coccineum]|uniref:Peptidylprolyl isomerase n=1 Tax=Tanacetum coccineum TaxID=301880 RepID=A0ABQ5GBP7_9ASTR